MRSINDPVYPLFTELGRQTTFSEFGAERVLLVREAILVMTTLYSCSLLGC